MAQKITKRSVSFHAVDFSSSSELSRGRVWVGQVSHRIVAFPMILPFASSGAEGPKLHPKLHPKYTSRRADCDSGRQSGNAAKHAVIGSVCFELKLETIGSCCLWIKKYHPCEGQGPQNASECRW